VNEEISLGVMDLAKSLRRVQEEYELSEASATRRLPDGHAITLRWCDDSLELERDDGYILPPLNAELVISELEEEE